MKELTKEDLKNIVREVIISNGDLKEYDIITKDQKTWEALKDKIKDSLSFIIYTIDKNKYESEDGRKIIIGQIDALITNLNSWKKKLENRLY